MRNTRSLLLLGGVAILAACSAERPSLPTAPAAAARPHGPPVAACQEIRQRDIVSLFPPKLRGTVTSRLAHVRHAMRDGETDAAREAMFALWQFTLARYYAGELRGEQSEETRAAVLAFGRGLYCLVGLDASALLGAVDPLSPDNVVQVVFPSPTDQDVVTGNGNAGVRIPGNTLSEPVTIAISLITTPYTPPSGPLNTRLDQYGPFFEFQVFPSQTFSQPVLVSQCLEAPADAALPTSVHLAHNVGEGIEILQNAESFLACMGGSTAEGPSVMQLAGRREFGRALGRLGSAALRLFTPSVAYAVSLGIGGRTTSFSPFGGVDALAYVQPVSATEQAAPAGTAVAEPPSVLVRTLLGTPLPAAAVYFSVTAGGGTITAGGQPRTALTLRTGDDGLATLTSWTLGEGANSVTASGHIPPPTSGDNVDERGNPVTFTATGTTSPE